VSKLKDLEDSLTTTRSSEALYAEFGESKLGQAFAMLLDAVCTTDMLDSKDIAGMIVKLVRLEESCAVCYIARKRDEVFAEMTKLG